MSQDADLDFDFDSGQDLDARDGGLADARQIARERAAADAAGVDAELAAIQGTAAGVAPEPALNGKAVPARTVELLGKRFKVAAKVGLLPLLKFSAFSNMDVQDSRALGAMYSMLKDCIHADEWRAFEDHATDSKADADELLDVISKAIEQIAGRPTEPPAASSRGSRAISGGSTGSSSSRRAKGSRR